MRGEAMIRHTVLFRPLATTTEYGLRTLMDEIAMIERKQEGFVAFEHGENKTPEDRDHRYRYGFTATFRDWAALAAYQADPEHLKTGKKIVAACEPDAEGILVFDYVVD